MNYEEIKKLIDDMGESKVDELKIEFPDGIKISMKKNEMLGRETTNSVKAPIFSNNTDVIKEEKKIEEGKVIYSPMVGTFYSKSSPSAEPFVKVGDKVKKGDVLCIIEAMKLMNEIESEYDGEIIEIYIQDDEMVEYGKPLFRIK